MSAWARLIPLLALVGLAFGAVYLSGSGAEVGPRLGGEWWWVLAGMGAAFLAMLGAIGWEAWRLGRDLRRRAPGAPLSWRILKRLVLLVLPPLVLLFFFALRFVHGAVDAWFRVDVENALGDALAVAQRALADLEQQQLGALRGLAPELDVADSGTLTGDLQEILESRRWLELTVFGADRSIRASVSGDPRFLLPSFPDENQLAQLRRGSGYADVEREAEDLHVRMLVALPISGGYLQARAPVDAELARLARNVERQFFDYRQLAFLQEALKYTLSVVLSVVLLAAVLFALYLAFALARGLVAPIQRLVAATRAIAAGEYRTEVAEMGDDELGGLARAFNQMARELDQANRQLTESATDAEARRRYFESVLERISSGVLSLDGDGRLRTANGAAQDILGVELGAFIGLAVSRLAQLDPLLEPFVQQLERALQQASGDWRAEVKLQREANEQLLLLRGARLPAASGAGGLVVVFDDQGEYARAQRDSAWSEVARRLAHEIKNPLTPIQLAAERLRRRLLARLGAEDADVLDRSTHTIVAQVEALKTMVNAFSDYARPPRLELRPMKLSALLREIGDLYANDTGRVDLVLHLPADELSVRADPGRLRQLLLNLIANAEEAEPKGRARVEISLHSGSEGSRHFVELEVRDHGPGIPAALMERLFEPYTTTKAKGTGLGLAIVKKIVDEHGGQIRVDNAPDGGARFRVRLPL